MSVLVLAAVRTPLGALGGALRPLSGPRLGALAIQAALDRAGLAGEPVDEVVMGCAVAAGMGPNPARQAALGAGLPESTPAWTLNQLGASGLMAVVQAARGLELGQGRLAVAGALESHSNAPYLLPSARWGKRMGETELRDGLLEDGPGWFQDGAAGEAPARSGEPGSPGLLAVTVPGRRGPARVDRDAWPADAEPGSPQARPAQARPAQAPPADGAAALVLATEAGLADRRPLGRILGFASGPGAAETLAARAGVPLWEIHRPAGPGHLLALGGAALLVDLLHDLRRLDRRHGLALLASGDGQTLALLLELC